MSSFQFGLLESKETNANKLKQFDEQLSLLPTNTNQEKLAIETPKLSEVELEIMHMVLAGKSINQISMKIFRTIAAVKWRLSGIYEKFGVANRLELIDLSYSKGLQFISEKTGIKQNFTNRVELIKYER